jgi:rhamnosyl/mannosyltransferase
MGNVSFAGQVSDSEKVALLRRCRALVLLSHLRSETYGMALVEAAVFGRSLISCEISMCASFANEADSLSRQRIRPALDKACADLFREVM